MYADPILALFHKRFFIPASHGFVKHILVIVFSLDSG
jgi:hypothetical protein